MLLPVTLNLKNRRCLVVGGGAVAERKARSLLECEAQVQVVSPELSAEFESLRSAIEYSKRTFQAGDCAGHTLVFACTNLREVNEQILRDAQAHGVWCNVADDAAASDFHGAATVRRGDVTVAISTFGGSPALSRHLKGKVEACIGEEYAQLLELMSAWRAKLERDSTTQQERAALWRAVLESDVLELLRRGETERAQSCVRETMQRGADELRA